VTKHKISPPHATSVKSTGEMPSGPTAQLVVVAVGASAGGLDAFTTFLNALPPSTGMAFILVQHLDPTHKSLMGELLSVHTKMPIHEAVDGTQIEPNTVYVIVAGTYLGIHHGVLKVTPPQDRHGARMPFDFLLQSLGEAYGERAIGVILSGNGTDGSIGLKAIYEGGGLIVAQTPAQATHPGMPQSAIDTGLVDLILGVENIPAKLALYAKQMRRLDFRALPQDAKSTLDQITALLRERVEQDFSAYKPGTLLRRIARRMALHAITEVTDYLTLLQDDKTEADILAKDLLIHVTGFFRDAGVFNYLAATVIPDLVRQHPVGQPIRIWIPACSSGEEVYSLAILFLEAITVAKVNIKLQIFGSDLDERAVSKARTGKYSPSLATEISPERLSRFFVADSGGYRIGPILREAVIFTVHDILSDPPFARIDLVSCRNLLIYLLPEAQQRALSLMHFALRANGVLVLGIAESVAAARGDFEPISADLRIFRRIGTSRKVNAHFSFRDQPRAFWPRAAQVKPLREETFGDVSHKALLEFYAPTSVLVDQKDHCLYFFGATESYLQIPSGDAQQTILAMVRQGLRSKLRAALKRARSENAPISLSGGTITRNGIVVPIQVEVRPVQATDQILYLASFVETPQPREVQKHFFSDTAEDMSKTSALEALVETLQRDLHDATAELEMAIADQATISEESLSLNEEYQSANEELETSKEELQSLNEELTALNTQLSATVNQQRHTADDLENILRSSELAIVFLDLNQNIRFVSGAAKMLLRALDTDTGRPISDLANPFEDNNLQSDIHKAFKSLTPIYREVRTYSGTWYARQVLPYRGQAGVIRGVILTFNNISETKATELKIGIARAYADSIIDTLRQPIVVVDEHLRVVSGNTSFRRLFDSDDTDLAGQELTLVGNGVLNIPAMQTFLDRALAAFTPIEDYELSVDFPSAGRRELLLNARNIPRDAATGQRILIAIDDITERKHIAVALEIAKLNAEKANLGKSRFLAAASHDLRQPLQTLSLLHSILARKINDPECLTLIGKLNETLGAMAGMLDTLLDINQLEAGKVQPEIDSFKITGVLEHLKTEFMYLAKAKGLSLCVVPSSGCVRSDPLLLGQMIRNLLSNAVKYTKQGKILVGCRRMRDHLRIEVWDTGIGIPAEQLESIFEEYHQLGNPARERGLGLGLGLSIVNRLGDLLGHRTGVRSAAGQGSVFTIEVPLGDKIETNDETQDAASSISIIENARYRCGTLLVVEDDPNVREALDLLLQEEGYRTILACDGIEVTALARQGRLMPDLIIADYNLPGGRNGLQIITDLRENLGRPFPGIILTGDIATEVLRKVISAGCEYLYKPVNVDLLTARIVQLVSAAQPARSPALFHEVPASGGLNDGLTIYVVDDDAVLLASMREMLMNRGYSVETYTGSEAFLSAFGSGGRGVLVVDSVMPGLSGIDLLKRLKEDNHDLPAIMITGHGDITMAIDAMKAGVMDFIEKPVEHDALMASINRALVQARDLTRRSSAQKAAAAAIASLTPRERKVMDLVVEGLPNKQIAFKLNISRRTVETHRAAVMKRTGVESLPDLIRLVMQAGPAMKVKMRSALR